MSHLKCYNQLRELKSHSFLGQTFGPRRPGLEPVAFFEGILEPKAFERLVHCEAYASCKLLLKTS